MRGLVPCACHTYALILYVNISRFCLQGASLQVKPGQITAIVGLNRSGKSTCVKLLERFYQPQSGEILLDGQPLQSYGNQFLHEQVGGAYSGPVLFYVFSAADGQMELTLTSKTFYPHNHKCHKSVFLTFKLQFFCLKIINFYQQVGL